MTRVSGSLRRHTWYKNAVLCAMCITQESRKRLVKGSGASEWLLEEVLA
jgi:hypothetical protein